MRFYCTHLPRVQVGRLENVIGWYHSHPGYGCWLSGIDVSTQMTNQQYLEPWVAIVVRDLNEYLNVMDGAKCCLVCTGYLLYPLLNMYGIGQIA